MFYVHATRTPKGRERRTRVNWWVVDASDADAAIARVRSEDDRGFLDGKGAVWSAAPVDGGIANLGLRFER